MAKIRRLFETSLLLNFEHPEDALDRYWTGFLQTDLGKIYQAIPWGELIKVFRLKDHHLGRRATFSPQGKLALMFLKHYANCSDQQLVEQLSGNLYYQLFCGVRIAPDQPLTDGKLVSEIRCSLAKKLQIDQAQAVLAQHWLPYMQQTDIVLMDATCYESAVRYPTDQKLLWEAVEWSYQQLCSHCKYLGIRRPRTKYRKWKARYESYRRLRRKPAGRRRSITGGLLRLFAKLDEALTQLEQEELALSKAYFGKRELMQRAYRQQFGKFYEGADIKGRIISFAKPYLRPIVRGKEVKRVEFGAKVNKFQVDGINFIQRLDFNAFHEGGELASTVGKAAKLFGKVNCIGADAIYATNRNRSWCTSQHIKTDFKRKGRAGKFEDHRKILAKQIRRERATRLEGSFGNEKNRYGLQRIKARGQPTEILWIFFGIHTPNALQIGRRIEQHNALRQAA
ncbi:MAG: transposase [Bacteroidota bacterium]